MMNGPHRMEQELCEGLWNSKIGEWLNMPKSVANGELCSLEVSEWAFWKETGVWGEFDCHRRTSRRVDHQ